MWSFPIIYAKQTTKSGIKTQKRLNKRTNKSCEESKKPSLAEMENSVNKIKEIF